MNEINEDDKKYRQRREMRRKKIRRRRLRRNLMRALTVACAVIVVSVIAVLAVKTLKKKPGSTQSGSSVSAGTGSQAASAAVSSKADGSTANSSGETKAGFRQDGTFCDCSTEWTYQADGSAPDGDIVSTDKAAMSYEDMRKDLYYLSQRYPDLVTVRNFGTSLDNRELLEAVIGSGDAGQDIIIQYSMHAREYINTLLGMKQLEYILKNYQSGDYDGTSYTKLFSKIRLHIIPMMNPDGVMISEEGIDAIRDATLKENLLAVYKSDQALGKGSENKDEYWKTWKANARSVDLNRNFATDGWTTEMGTQQPSCSRYPGTGPNSEPEVKALIALNDSTKTICEIAYHTHGRIVYWDYGMEEVNQKLYKEDKKLAETVSSLTAVDGHDGYAVTSTVKDGQNPGGCSDYFMQIEQIPAITIETGRKFADDGSYNESPLPLAEFSLMWDENVNMLQAITKMFYDGI